MKSKFAQVRLTEEEDQKLRQRVEDERAARPGENINTSDIIRRALYASIFGTVTVGND